MTEMELAVERMHKSGATYREAEVESHKSSAEVLRLVFLEIADRYPKKIRGFTFESEYCYDDEGGYFISDSVMPLVSDCTHEYDDWDDYLFDDIQNGYGHAALCLLCDVHVESFAGEVTVAEARERRF